MHVTHARANMPAMSIDPFSDRAVYRQLADILRKQILDGQLAPGEVMPGEVLTQQRYGLGRNTVRAAFAVLRTEGLVDCRRGIGLWVRQRPVRREVRVGVGVAVEVRMPVDGEQAGLGLASGVPVLVVVWPDGRQELLNAEEVRLVVEPGKRIRPGSGREVTDGRAVPG